jgi:hypothetical protein
MLLLLLLLLPPLLLLLLRLLTVQSDHDAPRWLATHADIKENPLSHLRGTLCKYSPAVQRISDAARQQGFVLGSMCSAYAYVKDPLLVTSGAPSANTALQCNAA